MVALAALVWHSTHPDGVDVRVASALYARPESTVRSAFAAVTVLVEPAVAVTLAVAVAVWVWSRTRNVVAAAFCPVAVAAAAVCESFTKTLVARARPATAVLAHATGRSFPSGHATAATALGLATGLLAAVLVAERWRRAAGVGLGAYVGVVCLSRLVLGVHYLTDVVAGVAMAGAVVLALTGFLPGSFQVGVRFRTGSEPRLGSTPRKAGP